MKSNLFPRSCSSISALIGAASFVFVATGHAQSGGPYHLSWSTLGGGGGISRGGQFAMSGSVQPEAGTLSGGKFKIEGGFWSGITLIESTGTDGPLLKIRLTRGGLAVLSWPLSASDYILEEAAGAVPPTRWSRAPQAVVETATEYTVTVPAAGVMKYYRLKK